MSNSFYQRFSFLRKATAITVASLFLINIIFTDVANGLQVQTPCAPIANPEIQYQARTEAKLKGILLEIDDIDEFDSYLTPTDNAGGSYTFDFRPQDSSAGKHREEDKWIIPCSFHEKEIHRSYEAVVSINKSISLRPPQKHTGAAPSRPGEGPGAALRNSSEFSSRVDDDGTVVYDIDGPILFPAIGDMLDVAFFKDFDFSGRGRSLSDFRTDHIIFNDIRYTIKNGKVFYPLDHLGSRSRLKNVLSVLIFWLKTRQTFRSLREAWGRKEVLSELVKKYDYFKGATIRVIEHEKNARSSWITYEMCLSNGEKKKITFVAGDIMKMRLEDLGLKKVGMIYATIMGDMNQLSGSYDFWIKMHEWLSEDGLVFAGFHDPLFSGETQDKPVLFRKTGDRLFKKADVPVSTPSGLRKTILGILLSTAGAVIIGLSDFTFSTHAAMGDLLALAGAIMASAYLIVGRKLRQQMDLISYIFPVYSAGGLVVLLVGIVAGVSFFGYSSRTYVLFLMLAIVPQLIGHSTFNWALKFFSASTVAILILGEPIGSTLLAYWVLGETLSPLKAAGGTCILAGIYAAMRGDITGTGMIISREKG